ncbi:hypothetical protein COCCADRAFT_38292 [Bipolaris zeicola 26-R-13]|uniref:Uncharacterized protein n=1 Tax=Cochliobolus carbonum (strain 26-R-13) TaxID=930089 RepID=W6Y241_COCC2|nr:uncharacterized protein COCCADRAFT_38292 [Bipolaris zeicola 26-R-13]EUC31665.1 hypothetical protein COCCADRAFT_38292 [Bipolaris zeicola 26-R-13]
MSVPVCPPKQYSSSENGLPGPENLNVKSSMLLLIPFSTVPSVFNSHQSVPNSVLFVPSHRWSTPLPSPILFMTLILNFSQISHPVLLTAIGLACLACLTYHVTRSVCYDDAVPS